MAAVGNRPLPTPWDVAALSASLDRADHAARLAIVASWPREAYGALYRAARGHVPIEHRHLVPDGVAAQTEVVHVGRNTLPVFRSFQKRFIRIDSVPPVVAGYNAQPWRWLTGPGYFQVVSGTGECAGELIIDYAAVPSAKPAHWPEVTTNQHGLGKIVYGGITDHLRGLSQHVTLGCAINATCKNCIQQAASGSVKAWFVLIREP